MGFEVSLDFEYQFVMLIVNSNSLHPFFFSFLKYLNFKLLIYNDVLCVCKGKRPSTFFYLFLRTLILA